MEVVAQEDTTSIKIPYEHHRVNLIAARTAELAGEATAITTRKNTLNKTVGEAKGRLGIRKEVETFIDELRSDTAAKQVASFEALLSAIVCEILPGETPIKLELETERGMPALDIRSLRGNGKLEDIQADQGGAVNNAVTAGLRLAAVIKSGTARFLALDEPDNWLKTDRVPTFYDVFSDAAKRLDIQTLVISHHSTNVFPKDTRIVEIVGIPDLISNAIQNPAPQWQNDQTGIRSIQLENFQAFENETIHLSPSITAITGDNNLGKSTVIRALRAVFLGECRDSLVRHDSKQAKVSLQLANGRRLDYIRRPKKNPVNIWSCYELDDSLTILDGQACESGGRDVPKWVQKLFNIQPVCDLSLHISDQKKPIFLLDETPSKRASVLSIGQESDHARKMQEIHKTWATRDLQTVRNGEIEINNSDKRLRILSSIPDAKNTINQAIQKLENIENNLKVIEEATLTKVKIKKHRNNIEKTSIQISNFQNLPNANQEMKIAKSITDIEIIKIIRDRVVILKVLKTRNQSLLKSYKNLKFEEPSFKQGTDIQSLTLRLKSIHQRRKQAQNLVDALMFLPDKPEIRNAEDIQITALKIRDLQDTNKQIHQNLANVKTEINKLNQQAETLLKSLGGDCPTCRQSVSDAYSLLEHE